MKQTPVTEIVNKYSALTLERDYTTPRCNRARLDTGTFCNYNCEFCYYQGLLHLKTDYETILNRIEKLHEYGITQVDLSGGESSIHKNWFDILQVCNDKFEHISTLSNGWRFADEKFLIKSKECGLKEIMFSLHGYDQQSHDTIVDRKGAWDKITKAIKLAHKYELIVRINCTVYQKNLPGMEVYPEVIKQMNPLELNFLTLNYWTNNVHAEPIDYVMATEKIKGCIDKLKEHVRYINVRYTPFCFMVGYEEHVCNQFQHIYDLFDWNKEIFDYSVDTTKQYTHTEKIDMAYKVAEQDRKDTYTKPDACTTCKYFNICDGIEKQIPNPEKIIQPVPGKKIKDVNHYRGNFYGQDNCTTG